MAMLTIGVALLMPTVASQLAAICDRRGIAVGGEVASRGRAASPALAARAGRRVRVAAR